MSDETRKDQRVKVQTLKAKYKSATVEEFIEQYAADISRGGIFIKTPKPPPNGTLLKIEIQLKDATPVISAVGRVVWRREQPEGGQAAGMGIKFVKVDESSQSVIDRIVAIKGEEAGPRFDSTPPPPAETNIAAAGETNSEFFGSTNPAEEMPAAQDRTMMRQMSAFLGEALRGAVSGDAPAEPAKPAPSTAMPGARPGLGATAALDEPKPAAPAAAPASAGTPSSMGRPGGPKPPLGKGTMVGLAPLVPPPAATAPAPAPAPAAPVAPTSAGPSEPAPAMSAKPVAAGVPGKAPVKPIGKGTMVGLAPLVPPPAAAPAPEPAPEFAASLAAPPDPNATPPRGVNPAVFEDDDGGSTAVADRGELNKLIKATEADDASKSGEPKPEPTKTPAAVSPTSDELFDEGPDAKVPPATAKPEAKPEPAPAAKPEAKPEPAPAAKPEPAAPAATPPAANPPAVAAPAAPPATEKKGPPVVLLGIIVVLLLALVGVAVFALRK